MSSYYYIYQNVLLATVLVCVDMCEESKDFCSSFTIKATEGQEGQKLAHHTELGAEL